MVHACDSKHIFMKKTSGAYFLLRICCVCITMLIYHSQLRAQEKPDADSLYIAAKNIGFRGQYDSARVLMKELLTIAPDYYDASIFIARTYNWEGNFKNARQELAQVLNKDPKNYEALDALIDAWRWPNETDSALAICNRALQLHPGDKKLAEKKAGIEAQKKQIIIDRNKKLADSLYLAGRAEAFKSNFSSGRALLDSAIYYDRNYFDAYILKARTYIWQGQHAAARDILDDVLARDTMPARRKEAFTSRADLEVYDYRQKAALSVCDTALRQFPRSVEFNKKKAMALAMKEDYEEAIPELQLYIDSIPNDTQALSMMEDLQYKKLRNHVAAGYINQMYNKGYAPWGFGFVEYGHRFKGLQLIGRVNYASRFKEQGLQVEADAYVKLYRNLMLFLNTGYSDASILFPRYRFGGELYYSFLKKFDVSLGYHYVFYKPDTLKQVIHLLTGSLGYYHGKFWFCYRPVLVLNPLGKGSTSLTSTFQTRWYYKSELDYFTFTILYGNGVVGLANPTAFAPSQRFNRLATFRLGVEMQRKLARTWTGGLGLWWDYDEFPSEQYRQRYTFLANLKKVF